MSDEARDPWAAQVQRTAAALAYPPTPDLAGRAARRLQPPTQLRRVLPRHPLWTALLLLAVLVVTCWMMPPVRAAMLEWLQLGAVRIWLRAPDITPTAPPINTPTPTPIPAMLDFAGETTWADAQARSGLPLRLPTYPADLGEPAHVYYQKMNGSVVILVWMEPARPQQVRMSLHLLGPGAFVWKLQPKVVQETQVHGTLAYWTEGEYYVQVLHGQANRRLVQGHVLIWTEGEITYRLETALPMAEAIRIAESLPSLTQ
ncbi:MAG: hypothetical protein R3C14_46560 [Caldilineaceae bacterium]